MSAISRKQILLGGVSALTFALASQAAHATDTVVDISAGTVTAGGGGAYSTATATGSNGTFTLDVNGASTDTIDIGATGANGSGTGVVDISTTAGTSVTGSGGVNKEAIYVANSSNHPAGLGAFNPAATINVTNAGTLAAGSGSTGAAITFYDTSSTLNATNSGSIVGGSGGGAGLSLSGYANGSKIDNSGLIQGESNGAAISINGTNAFTVINSSTGTLQSASGHAIDVQSASSSNISNAGTIGTSTGNYAVFIASSASVNTISNSGTIQAAGNAGVMINGSVTTLNNTGTITDTSGWGAIEVGDGGTLTTLTNSGTIAASAASGNGLTFWSTATSNVTNSGKILGGSTAYGLSIQDHASAHSGLVTGSLVNTGTIAGGSGGIVLVSTDTTGGFSGGITNSGTIDGGSSTNYAIDLRGNGNSSANTVTNSGYVNGQIALGKAGTLTITGGSITGAITTADTGANGSAVTLNTGSTYTLAGDIGASANPFQTVTLGSGTLSLGTGGTAVYGKTVSLGANTLTLTGNSTLSSLAAGGTTAGGGTINLASYKLTGGTGTFILTGNEKLTTTLTSSQAGYMDLSASTTSGLDTTTNSKILTISPTVSGVSIATGDKILVVKNNGGGNVTTADLATSGGSLLSWTVDKATTGSTDMYGNTISAGDVYLQATVTPSGPPPVKAGVSSGAPTSVNSALLNLGSGSAVDTAGDQLRPDVNRAAIDGAQMATTGALTVVTNRLGELRIAQSGGTGVNTGEAMRGLSFWAQGFGFYGDQGARKGVDGYTAKTGGLAVGGDARVTDAVRAGLALSWAHTWVDDTGSNDGNGQTIDTYQATLYGSYTGSPWYVDGAVAYGLHQYDTFRNVSFTGFSDRATGSHDGYQYTAKMDAGWPIEVGASVVTPTVGLVYSHLDQDGYTESSSNGAALVVDGQSANSVRSSLGAELHRTFVTDKYKITPKVQAAWQHEFINTAISTTAAYAAGGSSFTVTDVKPAQEAAVIGLGIDIASTNDVTISAKYTAEIKDAYLGQTGLLQFRKDF